VTQSIAPPATRVFFSATGLLQAVEALSEIANEPRFSRKMLWLTQERIEEVRAWMNTTLG
jgi:hypothetical protein